jgi:CheY-like chemotaxis protein
MSDETTILVVDDNEDLLETFSLILRRRGFHVETAGNGAAAVDRYRERSFDVTLMDIVMPEMNGVEAFHKIKEIDPEAVVILMTGYPEEDLTRIARDEGASQVINKPIRIDKLMEAIKEATLEEPILIIDDDAIIRLAKQLESSGTADLIRTIARMQKKQCKKL